jgi:pimeloyl-ACP methyl ester carboxylesterase
MGDGRATPVVLLHGLYDSHRTWKQVDEALARDRRVLIPDLPGHGLSGRPDASYALAWYARVVARWIAALGLEQVDVVGHSFGGGVAQMLLLECPERIRRLVLVASGGLGREIRPVLRLASVPIVVEAFGQPFMGFGTRLALRTGNGFSKEEIEKLAAMNAKPGSARAFSRTVRDIIDWRGQRRGFFQRVHEVGKLPPIAVFWGDRDKNIPIAHGRRLVESLDGVTFITFEGCGHYLHREQPGVFARALREFLDAPRVPAAKVRPKGKRLVASAVQRR